MVSTRDPDLCAVDNDVNPRKYLGRFFVDSLVHDSEQLKQAIALYGHDRVVLGTDYPFPLGEQEPGKLVEGLSSLTPEARGKLLCTNALDWLGKSAHDLGFEP